MITGNVSTTLDTLLEHLNRTKLPLFVVLVIVSSCSLHSAKKPQSPATLVLAEIINLQLDQTNALAQLTGTITIQNTSTNALPTSQLLLEITAPEQIIPLYRLVIASPQLAALSSQDIPFSLSYRDINNKATSTGIFDLVARTTINDFRTTFSTNANAP